MITIETLEDRQKNITRKLDADYLTDKEKFHLVLEKTAIHEGLAVLKRALLCHLKDDIITQS